ncbi:MAG TPA: ABC transporter permease [Bryobacteraceae bacterium]|nr:ABC transporter permease [Bryobacteraceae bacterium]
MKFFARREASLDNEIQDYLERETRDNIDAGMTPDEARHAAMRKFGRPVLNVKEETRAVWGWIWIERLFQDLSYARRMLAKNPGFALVAIISLGIGIGANCSMFSLADTLLLRPLPVLHPSQVVTVGSLTTVDRFSAIVCSYRDYIDFRDQNKSFDGLLAYRVSSFGLTTQPGELPQLKYGVLATGNFFRVLGVEPELGRGFRPEEDQVPGRDAVVVLGHDLWEKQFAADRSILGRKVRINGIEFTVIGVSPERFNGLDRYFRPAFYIPIMMWPRFVTNPKQNPLQDRSVRELTVKGRLKPGVTVAQAQSELEVIANGLEKAYPDTNRNQRAVVRTELQARIEQSPPDAQLVAMLTVLAGAVLLVSCANVAGLLLSRARVRTREIALRLAVGAGRLRLIRQLLTESLLVGLAGGAVGLVVAYGGVVFLNGLQPPSDLPIDLSMSLDRRVLFLSLLLSLASVLLFGLIPAIQATRSNLVASLRTAGADTPGKRRLWGRNVLVAGQVAVSLVLIMVAAFMFGGIRAQIQADPGFRTDHLLMMSFDPSLIQYTPEQTQQFYRQLAERARSVSGVRSVAWTFGIPFGNQQDGSSIFPEGYEFPKGKDSVNVFSNTVDENYFDTMGVRLVRGRGFLATDSADAPHVAVVNEVLANQYWPGQDPVGKRFRLDDRNSPWVQIVGVARTVKYLWVAEAPMPFLYLPLTQHPKARMTLLAESAGDPAALAGPLREVVRSLDANQPMYDVRRYEDVYRFRAVNQPRMIIETIAAMGLMGLVLAMVGLYGLVAYSASRRTREIGIRMAIGAHRYDVLRMVLRQGLVLALAGLGFGLLGSFGAERVLRAMYSGGGGVHFTIYLTVVPVLLAVVMLAAFVPARRASKVEPMVALHYE